MDLHLKSIGMKTKQQIDVETSRLTVKYAYIKEYLRTKETNRIESKQQTRENKKGKESSIYSLNNVQSGKMQYHIVRKLNYSTCIVCTVHCRMRDRSFAHIHARTMLMLLLLLLAAILNEMCSIEKRKRTSIGF